GVTVMAGCQRAGVGRTSFYNYFADVPDLLRTVIDETGQAVQAQFEALHGERRRGIERLERCLQMVLQLATNDPEFGLVLTALATSYPETADLLREQIHLELSAAGEAGVLPSLQGECAAQANFLTTTTLAVARDLAAGRLDAELSEVYAGYLMHAIGAIETTIYTGT
ncbi:MAG: TetR/AcrR family transcriptional regulator, partial [Caldilineaceae bacterium]|nr:TetR/AcrR family transcriptional regulator [Caldilineaceae bacterium]